MKKFLSVVLIVVILFFGFIFLRFGSALTQEGNPVPYLISIMKLELSNNGYQEVVDSDIEVIYVSEYKKKYPYGMPKEFMKDKGWTFKEQLGSGFVFEKNEEVITIETRKYSRRYYIWKVPKEIVNQKGYL